MTGSHASLSGSLGNSSDFPAHLHFTLPVMYIRYGQQDKRNIPPKAVAREGRLSASSGH